MSDSREKRVELILQQLSELPTLPVAAVRVLEVTSDDQSSVDDVVKILSNDQSIATRILELVQRADVGVAQVDSIERAVSLLGFDAVRNAVLALAAFQTFQSEKRKHDL